MTTTDPLSLTEAKRLAANADTLLLRATRPADLETPIGAFLRLDDGTTPAYLLESVEGGERLGRYSFLGVGPRRLLEVRDGLARTQTRPVTVDAYSPDLPVDVAEAPDPLDRDPARSSRAAASSRPRGCRASPAARSARSPTTRSARSSRRSRCPDRDPVGAPTAAFIETDLVLVFDHLTHTLSAIASLHTETPDLEGRYRIAEEAIFEALERTARPSAAELAGGAAAAGQRQRRRRAHPRGPGRHEPRARRLHPRGRGRQGRDRVGRGDPGRARPAPVVRPPDRSRHRPRRSTGSPSTARSAGSTRARTCSSSGRRTFEVVGASPELLLQVEGDRLTTHPIAGHPAARRRRARGPDPRRAAPAGPEGAGRAHHARRPRPERPRAGLAAGHRHRQQVHGGRAVQPRPPSRVARRGPAAAGSRRARRAAGRLPGRARCRGAPKVRAMQLIAAAEGERRGLYGGAVGYLGYDGNLDTAITIRSAVLARGPGPHPYRRRDRRWRACRRRSSRRPSTRLPPCGGRSSSRSTPPDAPRTRTEPAEAGAGAASRRRPR